MIFHPAYALPLLAIGCLGFSLKRTVIGAILSALILMQSVLTMAAIVVFQEGDSKEAPVLVWIFSFLCTPLLLSLLVLSLRQYYAKKNVNWEENEEIKR